MERIRAGKDENRKGCDLFMRENQWLVPGPNIFEELPLGLIEVNKCGVGGSLARVCLVQLQRSHKAEQAATSGATVTWPEPPRTGTTTTLMLHKRHAMLC